MPVRFVCPQCKGLLSVSNRKVGATVHCPRCQADVTVPAPDEAAAEVERLRTSKAHLPANELADLFADLPALLDPPTALPVATALPAALPALPEFEGTELSQGSTALVAQGMLLVSRRVLYAQAVILALVALGAFVAGYLIGNSSRPTPAAASSAGPR